MTQYQQKEPKKCSVFTHVACSMQIFWKKGSVYIRKEFNSHRIGLEYQHGRRFIVLEHQYGRREVM